MPKTDERRTHSRYPLRAFAELGSTNKQWAVHVLDISYDGARLALLDEYTLKVGDSIDLRIEVPPMKVPKGMPSYLHLQGTVVHQQDHILGIHYQPKTDIDAALLLGLLSNLT